jgi:hypothetical protein
MRGASSGGQGNRPQLRQPELPPPELRNHNRLAAPLHRCQLTLEMEDKKVSRRKALSQSLDWRPLPRPDRRVDISRREVNRPRLAGRHASA